MVSWVRVQGGRAICSAGLLQSGLVIDVSERYGEAAYAEIPSEVGAYASIATGAEDGSEMGAFCSAKAPVKERSLLIKYREYMPVGAVPVLVHAPGPDPDGERRRALPRPPTQPDFLTTRGVRTPGMDNIATVASIRRVSVPDVRSASSRRRARCPEVVR